MKVVHVARTPLAGSPTITSQMMNKYMPDVSSHAVIGRYKFRDGKEFPYDILYSDPMAFDVAREADVFVVHNAVRSARLQKILLQSRKRIILVCHSQPDRVEKFWIKRAASVAVVAQYQPRLYTGMCHITLVPNMIPLEDGLYRPKKLRDDKVTIAHSPSNAFRVMDKKHRLYWDNKGTAEIQQAIRELKFGNKFFMYTGLPLEKTLKVRRKHHIVIDDMHTGSYHRVSLEACAQAQMAICAADRATIDCMQWVSGVKTVPFHVIRVKELKGFLKKCVDRPKWVNDEGARARQWMVEHWASKTLCENIWRPLLVGKEKQYF